MVRPGVVPSGIGAVERYGADDVSSRVAPTP